MRKTKDKKYLFFDIDGTLTSTKQHGVVPEVTKQAIRLAKENGHFLAIATGRSYHMAKEFAYDLGIDHLVCNGGNDLYIDHQCLWHESLNKEVCLEIIQECLEKQLPFCVTIDETTKRYSHSYEFLKAVPQQSFMGTMHVIEDFNYHEVKQFERIMIAIPDGVERTLDVFQKHHLPMRYNPYYCILEPDHKDHGIQEMMKQLDHSMDDVVVFGDSRNDLRMFRIAPLSIAMGNGIEELKEIASYVTLESDEGGIFHALQHFGWI